ncbi:glycosyltransferase [Labilibaculum sp. A4]|uniref:glycosyltransferase family 4 protein n=1 Tax=Labilibaculum euxinus TaxID=2686357 RepID=UPI000F61F792|nr:glycosyltransferase family 4 protein [Labilibaculum euxinus]MDQ1772721.1 glycosyltransferase family 4 protein [Labilibaculum euxinus]MWN78321.1 glycosyltransferase [Labilibaculum euxinus]
MEKIKYVYLIDPFGYGTDYNICLTKSLNKYASQKLKFIYITSEINNSTSFKYQVSPFFRITQKLRQRFPKIQVMFKILGILEYYYCYFNIIYRAKKKSGAIHTIWIKSPIVDIPLFLLMKILNIPVYHTMHNAFPHDKESFFTRIIYLYFYRIPDKLIVLSNSEREKVCRYNNRLDQKIVCIPHGLMSEEIPCLTKSSARGNLKIDYKGSILLFLGLIRPYKGIFNLIEACALLKDRGVSFRLIIAGKNNLHKADFNRFSTYVKKMDWIYYFEGYHSKLKMRDFICSSDLVVLPYSSGTQSGISYTALRYCVPILPTSVGNLLETVPDRYKTLSPPPQDIDSLANSISAYLDISDFKSYFKDLDTLKKYHSWENIAKSHLKMIYK